MTTPKRYKTIFASFMSFFDGTTYDANDIPHFTQEHLLTIKDVDIVRYLNVRTYGKPEVEVGDKPLLRSATVMYEKKALSHYMPRIAMNWDDINQIGNPTKSAAVNNMIRGMALHQVRGSGVKSSARRAFEWVEFVTVLLATRELFSETIMSTILAVMTLQWQLIGRIDDVMKLATSTVLKHTLYPFALNIKMCWSKNIRTEQESPTQILFASMDPLICPMLHLGIFMETVGTQRGGWLFGNTNRNTSGILKTILNSRFFTPVFQTGKLGTHSIRKGAATFASRNGIPRDWIQQRGRWRGHRRQVDVYIDNFQPYPDARVAAVLCGVRGACKYVFKNGGETSNEFLESITPCACEVFGVDVARVLALPLLWAAYEGQVTHIDGRQYSIIPNQLAHRIKGAWIHAGGDTTINPLKKIKLSMQQFGDQLQIVPLNEPDGGGGGGGGGGGEPPNYGTSTSLLAGGGSSDAYFAQLFTMQQRIEDMRSEVLTAVAENKRYMQTMNSNVRRISQFRHIVSTKVSDHYCNELLNNRT